MCPAFALHRGRPLSAKDERRGFSKGIDYDGLAVHLADFIESECKKQSCGAGGVLALCGEWGSGKTSFIIKSVYELTRRPGWKEPGVFATKNCSVQCTNNRILYFDPWMFSSREELILQFFKSLCEKFPKWEDKELRARLINYGQLILETLPDLLGIASAASARSVSGITSKLSSISSRLKGFSGTGSRIADAWTSESLGKAKQELSACLAETKPRLVIIDNVDRLSDAEIRDVFRFIGAVMNLPNIVYLVAFDRSIVAKALEDLQHGGRERFLDKIVGAYYFLPKTELWQDISDYFYSFPEWRDRVGKKEGFARAIAEVLGTHREFNKIRLQLDGRLFLEDKGMRFEFFLEECLRELSHETYQRFITLSNKERNVLIGLAGIELSDQALNTTAVKERAGAFLEGCCFAHNEEGVNSFIDGLGHLNSGAIEEIDKGLIGWGSLVSEAIRVWIVLRLWHEIQPNKALDNMSQEQGGSGIGLGQSGPAESFEASESEGLIADNQTKPSTESDGKQSSEEPSGKSEIVNSSTKEFNSSLAANLFDTLRQVQSNSNDSETQREKGSNHEGQ